MAVLLKRLVLYRTNDNEDMHEHLRNFSDTIDRLSSMEVNIDPNLLCVLLLLSLPPSFDSFRCAIETRDKLPTPEDLCVKIMEEWDSRKHGALTVESNATYVKK